MSELLLVLMSDLSIISVLITTRLDSLLLDLFLILNILTISVLNTVRLDSLFLSLF